jgi:hypothetical protein
MPSVVNACSELQDYVSVSRFVVAFTYFWTSAMLERQPALLSVQLTEMTRGANGFDAGNATEDEPSSQMAHARNKPRKVSNSNEESVFWIKIQLFRRHWHFYSSRSRAGWDFGFRLFNIISHDSDFLQLVLDDNVELLREMFRSGEASPLTIVRGDSRRLDQSLLAVSQFMQLRFACKLTIQYSVGLGSLKVCQLLLNEGAKAFEESLDVRRSVLIVESVLKQF